MIALARKDASDDAERTTYRCHEMPPGSDGTACGASERQPDKNQRGQPGFVLLRQRRTALAWVGVAIGL